MTAATQAAPQPVALPARLSPSALGRYRICPRSFLLTDVQRSPRREEASPILAQGNAVHHALERFFGLPIEDRQPENLERALRSVWHQHRKPGSFASRDEEAAFGQAALDMLYRFTTRFDVTSEPLAREQWVSVRLGGLQFYGKIDRVDRTAGGIALIDYKSGRKALDPDEIPHEPAVQIYLLGAEADFKLPVESVRFIYLTLEQEVCWQPEREDVEGLKDRLLKTVAELREDQLFDARPGDHCRFCPAALQCSDRQAVALDDLVPVEGLPF